MWLFIAKPVPLAISKLSRESIPEGCRASSALARPIQATTRNVQTAGIVPKWSQKCVATIISLPARPAISASLGYNSIGLGETPNSVLLKI